VNQKESVVVSKILFGIFQVWAETAVDGRSDELRPSVHDCRRNRCQNAARALFPANFSSLGNLSIWHYIWFFVLSISCFIKQDEFTSEDFAHMTAPLLYSMLKSKTRFPLHSAIKLSREDVVFLFLVEHSNEVGCFFYNHVLCAWKWNLFTSSKFKSKNSFTQIRETPNQGK
jgi:hypothetical protein